VALGPGGYRKADRRALFQFLAIPHIPRRKEGKRKEKKKEKKKKEKEKENKAPIRIK